MATQIIDGFQINCATPVDTRIVASGQIARDNILYKYDGMRVFDTSDGIPYVWLHGTFSNENSNGVAASNTTTNYIPIFTSSNVVTNSVIYQNGGNIGIGTTSSNSYKLTVNGDISATKFVGNGSLLTNLNASSVTSGTMSVSRLSKGGINYILRSGVTTPEWVDPSEITVGRSLISNALVVTIDNTTNTSNFIMFASQSGNTVVKVSSNLNYNPSTSQLLLPSINSVTTTKPTISFASATASGIYRNTSGDIVTCINGSDKMKIASSGISHINSTFTNIGTYFVGTGTELETSKITIDADVNDRIIYISTSDLNNIYYMYSPTVTCWFQTKVYIGSQVIYSSFQDSQFGAKTFQQNFNFILPCGVSAIIKQQKEDIHWSSGSGPIISVKSLKFGL